MAKRKSMAEALAKSLKKAPPLPKQVCVIWVRDGGPWRVHRADTYFPTICNMPGRPDGTLLENHCATYRLVPKKKRSRK